MKIIKNNKIFIHKNIAPLVNPNVPTQKKSRKSYLIKRIIVTNGLSLIIVVLTYLWMVFLLSSVSSFWDLFRGKDIYVDEDKTPPIPPFLKTIPEATQSSSIDIVGQSESGVKVELFVDGSKVAETVSDSNGGFVFAAIPVGVFKQEIFAKAIDDTGNDSNMSNIYAIQQDTTAPEVEITSAKSSSIGTSSTGHTLEIAGKLNQVQRLCTRQLQ